MSAHPPKPRVPAVEGWFTLDGTPALIGTRCETCGTFFFPPEGSFCRNPECAGTDLRAVRLSNRGTVWSWTVNRYPPPAPFVAADPFQPFAVAAVELAEERIVVLGQVSGELERLRIGDEMELVVDTLSEDDERRLLVWKWRRV